MEIRFANASHSTTDGANPNRIIVTFTMAENANPVGMGLAIIHEGSHVADWQDFNFSSSIFGHRPEGPSLYTGEVGAYTVSSYAFKALGVDALGLGKTLEESLAKLPPDDREAVRAKAVDSFMTAVGGYTAYGEPLTARNPGPTFKTMRENFSR